jgi:hypothetical protein
MTPGLVSMLFKTEILFLPGIKPARFHLHTLSPHSAYSLHRLRCPGSPAENITRFM